MSKIDCEEEKRKYLKAYECYDANAMDSLAEIVHIIPDPDFPAYDDTPENAVIFATTGMDGGHYYMVENDNIIDIYYVEPNMGDEKRVFLIGHSISEILSYGFAISNLLFSQVFDLKKDEFLQEIIDAKQEWKSELNSRRFKNDLNALEKVFPITKFSASEVYDRLKTMNPAK